MLRHHRGMRRDPLGNIAVEFHSFVGIPPSMVVRPGIMFWLPFMAIGYSSMWVLKSTPSVVKQTSLGASIEPILNAGIRSVVLENVSPETAVLPRWRLGCDPTAALLLRKGWMWGISPRS